MEKHPLRIVLGVTSGIAAYKMPELVRLLRKQGAEVRAVLSERATSLVGVEALRTVTGSPVYLDGAPPVHDMDHIRLAEWGDWLVVCPATANTIAKMANGVADNLLTTLALCFEHRTMVAPAMNTAMWEHQATQHNCAVLTERGVRVLPVDEGELACGTTGAGRLLPLDTIASRIMALRTSALLSGVRVLIGSGPTEEPIDAVRVITNKSSGRMGAALAEAALAMGADVTVVSGPSLVPPPAGVRRIDVRTAGEMQAAMEAEFVNCQVCIMAAAVSDFRPTKPAEGKLAREQAGALTLELAPNPDILQGLCGKRVDQVVVGFSLETDGGVERASAKMERKGCDLMVLNAVESSLGLATTQATVLYRDRAPEPLPAQTKSELARHILTSVASRLGRTDD